MSQIVDFHSHLFSHAFFEALAQGSSLAGSTAEKIERVCEEAGIQPPSSRLTEHVATWLSELDAHGVQHIR